MIPLKILIIEDETITAMDLRETLQEAGHLVTAIARTYQDAVKAVKSNPPDLALIDIHLEGSAVNGIETAKRLLDIHPMPIMYLTANSEPATFNAAKETLPVAYLLKPFRHDELKLQVELAYHYFQSTLSITTNIPVSSYLYLPVDNGHEKIDPNDVLYVEADGSYVQIYLRTKKTYYISMNLGHLAQYFPTPNFYRLSRSLLINLNYLERLESTYLYLVNHETAISIPAPSRKELMNKLRIVRTKKAPSR
ncbi:response regulator [Spirosoma sp. HMF3257]|uniref:DNA-binding response regulator n=1 Tax=Spirosoma telluris TaxID=2183553 RepID=A0A327NJR1_9BACT|nr:response regulator [Spirosoma telluris]RAI75591.1 DNA-binding response regulator [Spirosoma telluris]